MTMQRRPTDIENKLLLLYAIDRLGAVTAQQLLLFMVENDFMGYISLQLGLAELDEAGLLRKQKHALGTLYALTGKGRDALSMFQRRVPHSRLSGIDEIAGDWRLRFRREKQMLADFQKKENGEYLVRLRLLEREEHLLDLKLSVPTHDQAQRFCDAWIEQAAGIYAHIMRALGEDEKKPEK
mgnify:CR=1 FL=1